MVKLTIYASFATPDMGTKKNTPILENMLKNLKNQKFDIDWELKDLADTPNKQDILHKAAGGSPPLVFAGDVYKGDFEVLKDINEDGAKALAAALGC